MQFLKKFWWFGLGIVAMAVLTAVILSRRQGPQWTMAPCGKVQWARSRLPAPIYFDTTLPADWVPNISEAVKLDDPAGKLLEIKGPLALDAKAPDFAIVIEQWNDDKHGNTHYEVDKTTCKVVRMKISVPVLMLPGKARTRAAAHELLHALGLGHSDWEEDISYPVATTLFDFRLAPEEKALLDEAYLR